MIYREDYGTKGHRVARRDRLSPVAKRGRTWATLVESECNESGVAQSPGRYMDIQMGRRDDLVDLRPRRASSAA